MGASRYTSLVLPYGDKGHVVKTVLSVDDSSDSIMITQHDSACPVRETQYIFIDSKAELEFFIESLKNLVPLCQLK